ncbi:hypothetical protein FQA39_LY11820 [Lamprigera yunnana]|nr:hypothetical protein FQA39_LY11820 [Lamprigera yunnana]
MAMNVLNYFGRERDNGGAFILFTPVMQRTAEACSISINTLTTIKKRFNEAEIENQPVQCSSKRPRCKPKSVDVDNYIKDFVKRKICEMHTNLKAKDKTFQGKIKLLLRFQHSHFGFKKITPGCATACEYINGFSFAHFKHGLPKRNNVVIELLKSLAYIDGQVPILETKIRHTRELIQWVPETCHPFYINIINNWKTKNRDNATTTNEES